MFYADPAGLFALYILGLILWNVWKNLRLVHARRRRNLHRLIMLPKGEPAEWKVNSSPNEFTSSDLRVLDEDLQTKARAINSFFADTPARKNLSTETLAELADCDGWQTIQEDRRQKLHVLPKTTFIFPLRLGVEDLKRYYQARTGGRHGQHSMSNDSSGRPADLWSFADNPVLLCLFLSAMIEPVISVLLVQSRCHITHATSIGIRNTHELRDPNLARGLVDHVLGLSSVAATVTAAFNRLYRVVEKGIEIDVDLSIWVTRAGETGKGTEVFRQTHTILTRVDWKGCQMQTSYASNKRAEVGWFKGGVYLAWLTVDNRSDWGDLYRDYECFRRAGLSSAYGNHILARAVHAIRTAFPEDRPAESTEKVDRVEVVFHQQMPVNWLGTTLDPAVMELAWCDPSSRLTHLNIRREITEDGQRMRYQILDPKGNLCIEAFLDSAHTEKCGSAMTG
ncbi:uncharacterized protein AB675_445 [Cyphellophora attinorum]|uniref:Uncharacterized protein n=1 Tax=Cyphellophora attinorum TaxID=1664694 RepID=A0A0N1HY40_9EURO|nr:uncharacterized protein AB675_445 [Phialophora attinorum]KPI45672.1 hypothetical protein AB675_445 [Phialophora attinorum]